MDVMQKLSRWVLGPDPERHGALRLTLLASSLYLFNTVLTLLAIRWGYVSPSLGTALAVCLLLGATVFFTLIRSGVTQQCPDPYLVWFQGVYCSFAVALAYLAVDVRLRGVVLSFMPVILLPCQFTLAPRQISQISTLAIALLFGVTIADWYLDPATKNVTADLLQGAYVSAVLLAAAFMARRVSQLHHDMKVKGQALASALLKVEDMASHDQLTGLINRRRMHEILDLEWQRARRQPHATTLIMMDLDHFKRVNDSLGHHAGDLVLQTFSDLVRAHLREADSLSRWGGEEFLVLCPETTPEQAQVALTRLRDHLHHTPLLAAHPDLLITFSAGMAALRPDETMTRAVERADNALYQAKNQGRDRVVTAP